jgi:hypothetical protein
MTRLKNLTRSVLLVPDAKLRLAPGEAADVPELTPQCLAALRSGVATKLEPPEEEDAAFVREEVPARSRTWWWRWCACTRSCLERQARHPTLPDDGEEGRRGKLAVVWNRDRAAAFLSLSLHDDVAAPLAYGDEAVASEDCAHFAPRENAQPTLRRPRTAPPGHPRARARGSPRR